MGIEGVVEVFKLPCSGLVLGRKEGYNTSIASYFIGKKRDHYIPQFGYVIIKTNIPLKIMKLGINQNLHFETRQQVCTWSPTFHMESL
jgi:hypothetical protein